MLWRKMNSNVLESNEIEWEQEQERNREIINGQKLRLEC